MSRFSRHAYSSIFPEIHFDPGLRRSVTRPFVCPRQQARSSSSTLVSGFPLFFVPLASPFRGRNFIPTRTGKCYLRAKPSSVVDDSGISVLASPPPLCPTASWSSQSHLADTAVGFRLKFPLSQSNSYFPGGSCHTTGMEVSAESK